MAAKTCPPGSYVLDAASFVSLQAVRNAVAHPNCDGLILYNGGRYGCTIDHVKIVVDSGKCMGPNWERRANEAMFGAGGWAVDSARAGVEKWGIDPSLVPTILSGVDFSTTTGDWAQLDYWHETGCDRADETNTWIGYYGETKYGNHLVQQPWWQRAGNRPTWTWGGNGLIVGTNVKQHYGFPSGIDWGSVGVTVDESRVETGLVMYAAEGDPEVDMTPDEMRALWDKEFFPQIVKQVHNEVLAQVTRSINGGLDGLDDPNIAGKGEYAAWSKQYGRTVRDETVPKNADGSGIFTDPFGNHLGDGSGVNWTAGYTLDLAKQILELVKKLPVTSGGGGPTFDQMVSACKKALDGAQIKPLS